MLSDEGIPQLVTNVSSLNFSLLNFQKTVSRHPLLSSSIEIRVAVFLAIF